MIIPILVVRCAPATPDPTPPCLVMRKPVTPPVTSPAVGPTAVVMRPRMIPCVRGGDGASGSFGRQATQIGTTPPATRARGFASVPACGRSGGIGELDGHPDRELQPEIRLAVQETVAVSSAEVREVHVQPNPGHRDESLPRERKAGPEAQQRAVARRARRVRLPRVVVDR